MKKKFYNSFVAGTDSMQQRRYEIREYSISGKIKRF